MTSTVTPRLPRSPDRALPEEIFSRRLQREHAITMKVRARFHRSNRARRIRVQVGSRARVGRVLERGLRKAGLNVFASGNAGGASPAAPASWDAVLVALSRASAFATHSLHTPTRNCSSHQVFRWPQDVDRYPPNRVRVVSSRRPDPSPRPALDLSRMAGARFKHLRAERRRALVLAEDRACQVFALAGDIIKVWRPIVHEARNNGDQNTSHPAADHVGRPMNVEVEPAHADEQRRNDS